MDYRRYYQAGGTYFFTVVSYRREPILIQPEVRVAVRQAIETVRKRYPFEISAWVLLPILLCLTSWKPRMKKPL